MNFKFTSIHKPPMNLLLWISKFSSNLFIQTQPKSSFQFNHTSIMAAHLLKLVLVGLFVALHTQVEGQSLVNMTFIRSSVAKGAVCLDGIPATYYYLQGSGYNWVVYIADLAHSLPTSCTSKMNPELL